MPETRSGKGSDGTFTTHICSAHLIFALRILHRKNLGLHIYARACMLVLHISVWSCMFMCGLAYLCVDWRIYYMYQGTTMYHVPLAGWLGGWVAGRLAGGIGILVSIVLVSW